MDDRLTLERTCAGAVLLGYLDELSGLTEGDFTDPICRIIYTTAIELEKKGETSPAAIIAKSGINNTLHMDFSSYYSYPQAGMHAAAALIAKSTEASIRTRAMAFAADPDPMKSLTDFRLDIDRISGRVWPEPQPVTRYEDDSLPEFPIDALPVGLRNMALMASESIGIDQAMTACLGLAAVSVAINKKAKVQLRPDWKEPLNLWILAMLPPGNKKSPAFSKMMAPLFSYRQAEAAKYHATGGAIEIEEKNARLEAAKRAMKKGEEGARAEVLALALELTALQEQQPGTLFASDMTPAALIKRLANEQGRFAILNDEANVFLSRLAMADESAELDPILSAHSGGYIHLERIGRESNAVTDASLVVGLVGQPSNVESIRRLRKRGVPARFLYAFPPSLTGTDRWNRPSHYDAAVVHDYDAMIGGLMRWEWSPETKEHANPVPYLLKLSPDAMALWAPEFDRVQEALGEGGALASIVEWGSKLMGSIARLAGVLHCATHYHAPHNHAISAATMAAAIRLGGYFTEHAIEAHRQFRILDDVTQCCVDMLRIYYRRGLRVMTRRDLVQATAETHGREAALSAIDRLAELGHLKIEENERGQPLSARCHLNPRSQL
jgi:hypothetical protein